MKHRPYSVALLFLLLPLQGWARPFVDEAFTSNSNDFQIGPAASEEAEAASEAADKTCAITAAMAFTRRAIPVNRLETQCFMDRPISSRRGLHRAPLSSHTQFLQSDTKACECMEQTFTSELSKNNEAPILSPDDQADEMTLLILSSSLNEKRQRLQNMNEGMVIQSMLIAQEKDGALDLMSKYAAPVDANTRESLQNSRIQLTKEGMSKLRNRTPEKEARLKDIVNSALTPPADVDTLQIPSSLPAAGSCISMRAYFAFEQISKDGSFYADLKKMNSFKEEEWNLEKLKNRYDVAYKTASNETDGDKEINSLKARINFLNKNPLISNLFSAQALPEESDFLKNKKESLLKIMQAGMKLGASAADFRQYQNEMSNLFSDPQVVNIMRRELDAKILSKYQDGHGVLSGRLPTTQRALENSFRLMANESVEECSGELEGNELIQCSLSFPRYCLLLSEVTSRINNEEDHLLARPSDSLQQESLFDSNLDPLENTGFKRLSKQICDEQREMINRPGVTMNFQEFKSSHCRPSSNKPECSVENNDMLVKIFLLDKSRPAPNPAGKSRGNYDSRLMEAYVKTFANVMEYQPKVEYTKKDMHKVSRSSMPYSLFAQSGYPGARSPLREMELPKVMNNYSFTDVPNSASTSFDFAAGEVNVPSSSENNLSANAAPSLPQHTQKQPWEASGELQLLKDELARMKKELADAKEKREIDAHAALEERIKDLETMVGQRAKDVKNKTEEIQNSSSANFANSATETRIPEAAAPSRSIASAPGHFGNSDEDNFRRIGAITNPDLSAPLSGAAQNGTALGDAGAAKKDTFNDALKHMNQKLLDPASEKSAVVIDSTQPIQAGNNIIVSDTEYIQLQRNKLEVLKKYGQEIEVSPGAVIVISVATSEQGERLVFHVTREGDEIVFRLPRKNKREDLILALP
jgi:hypothetical protein